MRGLEGCKASCYSEFKQNSHAITVLLVVLSGEFLLHVVRVVTGSAAMLIITCVCPGGWTALHDVKCACLYS